jgi:signal transduction histidine kinase/FixJ family two-component response regulator
LAKFRFLQSVKGKIIVASIVACAALFAAWETNRHTFKVVLDAFNRISTPNEKLVLVNDLSQTITQLDQEQKAGLPAGGNNHSPTPKINAQINQLILLYANAPNQVKRLNTLKKLLQDRDKFYADYAGVRKGLIDNKAFSSQIQQLTDIVNKSAQQTDSLVTSTERKTTTVTPATPVKKQHTGFFRKLFGHKTQDTASANANSYQVSEELHVKNDTLTKGLKDSLVSGMGQTMRKMQRAQQAKSRLFVKREALFFKANANVTRQMLSILKRVETDAVTQATLDNDYAKNEVKDGIKRISYIVLAFFMLTVLLAYFILRDVSRINRYRKELEIAKEEAEYYALAKHRFLSNMSHELRTPLQSILGFAELIRDQPQPHKKDIETIYRSASHLLQIVNEVLDYNRIVSGKLHFVNEDFSLVILLDEVLAVMRPQADSKGLELDTVYDIPDDCFLNGDSFRLKQVLYNLLGNAVKFTDAGTITLKVTAETFKKYARCSFEVTDTGAGLSEADISRIFNEFEQADDGKKLHVGTGLGLAIARAIVENQGGNIAVKSEVGEGSTFSFSLKFRKGVPAKSTQKQTAGWPGDTAGKVWLVDDDTFILEFCARVFDAHKIAYRCFNSPAAMLDAVWDDEVKFLLIDMRMPGMNGDELCARMRKKAPADTRIYALTAQVMPDELDSVTAYGFNGLLMKPFTGTELVALVTGNPATEKKPVNPLLNMDAIEKMTLGDPEQISQVLLHFAADTINDLDILRSAMSEKNMDEILLLAHRIAGRTAQIGAAELAKNYRLAEMELRKTQELTDEWLKTIVGYNTELRNLALSVREVAENEAA